MVSTPVLWTAGTADDDRLWAVRAITGRAAHVQRYRDYLAGDHNLAFATAQYETAFKDLLEELRANICPAVVAAIADRLKIEGFEGKSRAAGAAWKLFEERRLGKLANRLHTEAIGAGDCYLIVWPDVDAQVRFYIEPATRMTHEHDEERPEIVTKAAKMWRDGDRWRLTLYYPDRIEKWQSAQRAFGDTLLSAPTWEPYQPEGEPWPVPNPYGMVPVVHFTFDSDTHDHGRSILTDVIPLQDGLNKTLADRAVGQEFAAFPQRVMIGMEPDVDETGKPTGAAVRWGVDRIVTVANPDAKVETWAAADLASVTAIVDSWFALVARLTGIPMSYFTMTTGDFPSGEAQRQSESRLVARCLDTQQDFGPDWGKAMTLAAVMAGLPVDPGLVPLWSNPQARSDKTDVEILEIKGRALSLPRRQLWREAGYSEEEIARMEAEKADEAPAALAPGAAPVGGAVSAVGTGDEEPDEDEDE